MHTFFLALDKTVQGAVIGAGGIAIGSFIAAFFNWLNGRAIRRAEERKIIYDIASKLAVEQWKIDIELTAATNKEIKEKGGILHMSFGPESFQIPIPHIAHTVQRIITEIDYSMRVKSIWTRFHEWEKPRRENMKE